MRWTMFIERAARHVAIQQVTPVGRRVLSFS